jgi:hypothetical protein
MRREFVFVSCFSRMHGCGVNSPLTLTIPPLEPQPPKAHAQGQAAFGSGIDTLRWQDTSPSRGKFTAAQIPNLLRAAASYA